MPQSTETDLLVFHQAFQFKNAFPIFLAVVDGQDMAPAQVLRKPQLFL
jgi:hypothetical protein